MRSVAADSTDLNPYAKHGGKLLFFHGQSDPVFLVKETVS
jgi:hypothetical protein